MRSAKRSYLDLTGEKEAAAWRDEALRFSGERATQPVKISTPEAWLASQAKRKAQTTH